MSETLTQEQLQAEALRLKQAREELDQDKKIFDQEKKEVQAAQKRAVNPSVDDEEVSEFQKKLSKSRKRKCSSSHAAFLLRAGVA